MPISSISFRIELLGGEEETLPDIEAVNIPGPTNPANAGSFPAPPPDIIFTWILKFPLNIDFAIKLLLYENIDLH